MQIGGRGLCYKSLGLASSALLHIQWSLKKSDKNGFLELIFLKLRKYHLCLNAGRLSIKKRKQCKPISNPLSKTKTKKFILEYNRTHKKLRLKQLDRYVYNFLHLCQGLCADAIKRHNAEVLTLSPTAPQRKVECQQNNTTNTNQQGPCWLFSYKPISIQLQLLCQRLDQTCLLLSIRRNT